VPLGADERSLACGLAARKVRSKRSYFEVPDFLDPEHILEWLGPWAAIGLFAIIFAESGLLIGFFLPGDSLLFTAGLLAATAENNDLDLNIGVLLLGCFIAAVAGDQVGYAFGKKAGPGLFRRPDSRLFKQEYIHRTKDFFEQHGPKTIILARFVPIVRTFAPILAGVGEMPYSTFIRYNVVGGFAWAVGITSLGYVFGDRFPGVEDYLEFVIIGIVALSLIPPFLEWRKHRKAKALSAEEAAREAAELEDLLDGED
jgi:membrane-associated protein